MRGFLSQSRNSPRPRREEAYFPQETHKMPELSDNDPQPSTSAIQSMMRQSLLTDVDVGVNSARGYDAYMFTMPNSELERMQRRTAIVWEQAQPDPREGAAANIAIERIRDFGLRLEDETSFRQTVAQQATNERGELAYELSDADHAVSQASLAHRLAFHEARIADPSYEHGEGFDHIAAASTVRSHLLAQQLDAYDRNLPIEPSPHTQFLLGANLHDRATRAVLREQTSGENGLSVDEVASAIADHAEYVRDAIDQHRQFRNEIALDQDAGVYPPELPEDMEPAYDRAAAVVDAGIDLAYGHEAARQLQSQREAQQETVRSRLTDAQQVAVDQLTEAAADSYKGLGEPHVDDFRLVPSLMGYTAADDVPGTVYVHLSAAVTGIDDPEVAPVGDFRSQTGYIAVEPDGLLRPVGTRTDDAIARSIQRNSRSLNVAPVGEGQLEEYEAELEGDRVAIRSEARSAKGMRDHFNLEDEMMGGGVLHVIEAHRVADLYAETERAAAPEPVADAGVDPVAAEAAISDLPARDADLNVADMAAPEIGAAYMDGSLEWEDIAPSLSDNRLDELTAWIDAQAATLDNSLDPEFLARHDDLANAAYEEVYDRYVPEAPEISEVAEETLQTPEPFSRDADFLARIAAAAVHETPVSAFDVDRELAELSGQAEVSSTPARDAYLNARGEAAVIGSALASPQIKAATQLDQLEQNGQRIAESLPKGYDAASRPPVWRFRARAEWDSHQPIADALAANRARQDQIREQLGPNADKLVEQSRELVSGRSEILANTANLQRDAIDEELAREPEWLSNTLGPRPEAAAGRWQAIASDLAANRLRFGVTDDADPGIRPDQTMLADKVSLFRGELGLAQGLAPKADAGMGM